MFLGEMMPGQNSIKYYQLAVAEYAPPLAAALVTSKDGRHKHMELYLDEAQHQKLLQHTKNKRYRGSEASEVALVQTHLASYQGNALREIAELKNKYKKESTTHLNDEIIVATKKQEFMMALHGLLADFIEWEKLLNNAPNATPADSISILKKAVNTFERNLLAKIDAFGPLGKQSKQQVCNTLLAKKIIIYHFMLTL